MRVALVAALVLIAASCVGDDPVAVEDSTASGPPSQPSSFSTVSTLQPQKSLLSEADRSQILAAAASERLNRLPDPTTLVDVVEVAGRSDNGDVRFEAVTPLSQAERDAVVRTLAPKTVRFVGPDQLDVVNHDLTHVLLWFAEPEVIDGQLSVTSGLGCGELCGSGGAYSLEKNNDGTWSVTGTLGIQWES